MPGIGTASGFKLMVEDRGSLGLPSLQKYTDQLIEQLAATPGLVGVFTMFRSNTPQLYMDIDRSKVRSMGVTIQDLDDTLQIYLGSLYVNNFNDFGRSWQVNIMADGGFRNREQDINFLKVRNTRGEMAPAEHARRHARSQRPDHGHALQPLSGRAGQRCDFSHAQLGRGDQDDRLDGFADLAACR